MVAPIGMLKSILTSFFTIFSAKFEFLCRRKSHNFLASLFKNIEKKQKEENMI